MCFFCFCRQKTAYEIRISDWSSDVCSSDLRSGRLGAHDDVFDEGAAAIVFHDVVLIDGLVVLDLIERGFVLDLPTASFLLPVDRQIRSEERRVGKECSVRVDLGGCRMIKKKKTTSNARLEQPAKTKQ